MHSLFSVCFRTRESPYSYGFTDDFASLAEVLLALEVAR